MEKNKNQFVKADERQPLESGGGDDCTSEFDLGLPPMLLAYFVEDWGIGPPFLMRRKVCVCVSGSSRLDAVLTATRLSHPLGVGQGDKFKPSDMTGGCLALTRNKIKTKLYL